MDTASGVGRDTSRMDDDEEIGLAPLDEEELKIQKAGSEALSGSDILGRKGDAETEEAEANAKQASSSDSTKSLLEEELDELPVSVSQSGVTSPSQSGVRDPRRLGQASQSSEQDSTHTILLWLLVGAGTIILVLLLLGLMNM